MSAVKTKTTKAKKDAKPKIHPSYTEMISKAIAALKERKGSSRQAIVKYLRANFKFEANERVDVYVKASLRAGARSGKFVHTTGAGASGSFTLAKKGEPGVRAKPVRRKSPAKKRAAPAAAAPADASAAAASGDAAPAAAKKPRTPKKASPKKAAKKPAARKPAAKKPAAKKPAAKKAAAKKPRTPKKAAKK